MSNQGLLQASIRATTNTTYPLNGDWLALFALDGITTGTWDERCLQWINVKLSASYTNLPAAQHAYALNQGFQRWSDMAGLTLVTFTGVLDGLSGVTATSAVSAVRRLRVGHTGSLIRVARASDSTEQDIGYDGDGNLDTSALTTFCAGTNGYIAKLYDQSGNGNNFVITTPVTFGPQIVSSGSVITTIGSKPTMDFGDANAARFMEATALATPAELQSTSGFTIVALARPHDGATLGNSYQGQPLVGANSTSIASLSFFTRTGVEQLEVYCFDGSSRAQAAAIGTYPDTAVYGSILRGGMLRGFNNGNSDGQTTGIGTITLVGSTTYQWIGRSGASYYHGDFSELFFFATGLSNANLNVLGGDIATLAGETWTTVAW
jgi:hypothetical protein